MVKFKLITGLLFFVLLVSGCRKSDYMLPLDETIKDSGEGTGTVTWFADREYILNGLVFVNDGQTLTIEPGTVIRARTGQADKASALIVARGGRIIAKGTAEDPIIFTVEGDDLQGSIPLETRGLWGGLIILGNAPLNVSGNEAFIEGISISEPRAVFGGDNPEDNSGVLQYVSIRHGGTHIGEGNEINGLTLGGVGSGTLIDYVEIISNADDGVEFFGGTVNCRHLAVAFCGDDAFDFDMGYQGKGQYWLAIQTPEIGNLIAELDGSPAHASARPFTAPLIFNLTAIGRGQENPAGMISFRNNAGGAFINSIFVDQQWGVRVEYNDNSDNSLEQWQEGNLLLAGNTFHNVAFDTPESIFTIIGDDPGQALLQEWHAYFYDDGNQVNDPGIGADAATYRLFPDTAFQPGALVTPADVWFEKAEYAGAFKNYNWLLGWSALHQEGIIR
ncbi:MAG: hypothetical protein ACLFPE_07915 [Bacteroidales bacterium]